MSESTRRLTDAQGRPVRLPCTSQTCAGETHYDPNDYALVRPCTQPAMVGSALCSGHAGKAGKEAALQRMSAWASRGVERMIEIAEGDHAPAAHASTRYLLDRVLGAPQKTAPKGSGVTVVIGVSREVGQAIDQQMHTGQPLVIDVQEAHESAHTGGGMSLLDAGEESE